MRRADIKVAAAAGLSVYLPLYWLFTLPPESGRPNPLTAIEVGVLLLALAAYLLVPFVLSLLSRYPLAVATPAWLSISIVGSGILVMADVAFGGTRLAQTLDDAFREWLVLSAWTMPASAGVYYFGAVVRLIKAWHHGPDFGGLGLRK